jgi:hypothetical protein
VLEFWPEDLDSCESLSDLDRLLKRALARARIDMVV